MKNNNYHFGLKAKLISGVVFFMVISMWMLSFVILKRTEYDILNQMAKRGKLTISSLQKGIKLIFDDDVEAFAKQAKKFELQKLVYMFAEEANVQGLCIVNKDFKIIADNQYEQVGNDCKLPAFIEAINKELVTTRLCYTGSLSKENDKGVQREKALEIMSPLYLKTEVVGGVRVQFSLDEVRISIAQSQKMIIINMAIGTFLTIIFLSLLLSILVVEPIRRLAQTTERIAEGNLTPRVEIKGYDEIGNLSNSFNRMVDRLAEQKKSIEEYISSLERTQGQLIFSEKMASVGKLAAGVAHEVGNPLSAILGYINILLSADESFGGKEDYLERIKKEVQRIDKIMRDLLNFSRPTEICLQDVDINKIIEDTTSLILPQKQFHKIKISKDLRIGLPMVKADSHQLQQVFINIIMNAAQAMPSGGELKISTRLSTDNQKQETEADFIEVSFEDTGYGICEENFDKIFDPFFTTKESEQGTGLGLSICQKIVEMFNGRIEVDSKEGIGSIFRIKIPFAD